MRKRIGQIARGKFEYTKPLLSFSEEKIDIQVTEGLDYEGSFTISSSNKIKLRGVIYTTNSRMECLTPQFDGEEVKIRYRFKGRGLEEGNREEGVFVIVCSQCEYSLSFCATISKLYPECSTGLIKNLYDFSCLAKENWDEAYQIFYHKNFLNIINDKEVKEAMIYKGIIAAKPSKQNLEEFLIGIQKKNAINFTIEKDKASYSGITESLSEQLEIKKSSWGYIEIAVSTDAEFIRLSKTKVSTDDFIGSTYNFEYKIDANAMHGGRNFGRIYFKSPYESFALEITASQDEELEEVMESVRLQIQECKVGIMELYQAYRLKRIVTGVWANETIDILNHLHALDQNEPMYLLMKAQALIINRQRQEAEWILDDFKREWIDKKSPVWGYYLYLLTLMEREPTYVDKMTKEIEVIFYENPDSILLFWVLSFLQDQYYNNNARKLKAIEYWVLKGCSSPYLYLEAYYLIWQDPYLLTKLDTFELRVLRWAIRRKAMTKDIADQIFQIVELGKGFKPAVYKILCAAYEANPKPEYIGMICSYLIKGNRCRPEYHSWFEKGIELELRITGLYEAFMQSLDEREITSIPRIIQMYFQYDNTSLPYKKIAVLYNNIIAARNTAADVYQNYRRTMGRFAMDQARLGHMDDNLAVIYDDMLELGLINEDVAHSLSDIIFTNKLVVFDKKMVRAIVYQRQMKEPQIVPICEQVAYFSLFSSEYVILLEDEKGQRYISSVSYRLEKLMNAEKYLTKCIELAPDEISYIVKRFDSKKNYLTFVSEDKKYFKRLLFGKETSEEYKAMLVPEIIRFCQGQEYDEAIKEYMSNTDYSRLSQDSRKYLMDMQVWNHMYESACELVTEYGIDQIGSASKVALACFLIEQINGEKDEFLLELCRYTFLNNKYNDAILAYLCEYFDGPTDEMIGLWKAAKTFDIDTYELGERIVNQVIYTDVFVPDVYEVFAGYYDKGGREITVLAFISTVAHRYFVREQEVQKYVLEIIESRYIYEKELNDACRLALLKYISELEDRTTIQFKIQDELLAEYTRRNMNFGFYKKLDRSLVMKYHLYDKVFLEYRTDPASHVVLHYSRDEDGEDYIAEDMPDVYDGIFVKQFIMFFGEMIQYYITEEQGGRIEVTESSRLSNNDVYNEKDDSRYNLLNQMLISSTLQDETSLYYNMKQYEGFDEVTKKVFKLL